MTSPISPIEEIIADIKQGRMVILMDDEDRENEGDLVIAADCITPEVINFMAKMGRGLICLTLSGEKAEALNLAPMASHNGSRMHTNFTVSIEAREGITTGISAFDRCHTILTAINPTATPMDIVSPGHVFPLIAREGGVLVRTGHTEAATDLAKLAGFGAAGVICEIMNDDGTMARLPDLIPFAQQHGLKIGTIADLIAYRRRYDHLMVRHSEAKVHCFGHEFTAMIYINKASYAEHIALVKGDITGLDPVLVRMHAVNLFEDVLGVDDGRSGLLKASLQAIHDEGRGVCVLIRDSASTTASTFLQSYSMGNQGEKQKTLREYGVGAQILLDLGVQNMVLLSNSPSQELVGLEGYGLKVIQRRCVSV